MRKRCITFTNKAKSYQSVRKQHKHKEHHCCKFEFIGKSKEACITHVTTKQMKKTWSKQKIIQVNESKEVI